MRENTLNFCFFSEKPQNFQKILTKMPKNGFCKNRPVKHKPSGRTKSGKNARNTAPKPEPWCSEQGCPVEVRQISKPLCQKCTTRDLSVTRHFAVDVGPTEIIRIQFDAKMGNSDSEIVVHVAEGYRGSPLLSAGYIRRVQARCWRTKPRGGVISTLPDGSTMITTSQVISKLQKGGKFYRAVFGVVEGDGAEIFSKHGWQMGATQPDAVIGLGHFCSNNEIPENFA